MAKKLFSLVLALAMILTLAACSTGSDASQSAQSSEASGGSEASGSADGSALDWPKQDITVIVTHAAGGDTDYNARLLCRLLETELGVSVVPTNVTGSAGSIAFTEYKDADPDGYTFIMSNSASLGGGPATGLMDFGYEAFETVCVYGKSSGECFLVRSDSPYQTFEEFIEACKANPGTIKLGLALGGAPYIASVILQETAGAEYAIVEAGDASTRMTDLLGGHVDAIITPYANAKDYIESGEIRALCTLLSESPDLLPDIPSASECGYPQVQIDTTYICLAPKGTDAAVVEAMNSAIQEIVYNNEEYKEEVNSFNFQEPWALDPAESTEFLKEQKEYYMGFSEYLQG